MKSVMSHSFSQAPSIEAPRSVFDRSCSYKTAFDAGYLIPFLVDDVLPGDTFNVNVQAFARMSTPIYPIMDNMFVDTHFFFVPLRLVWDNARKFFGEQANPTDSIDYTIPQFSSFTNTEESLHDYMGLPVGVSMTPNSVYARAYNLIWNEWFRDQNLQDSVTVDTDDGPDTDTDYVLLKRGKRHDYFTSCLPWPQKGDASTLPLSGTAPVYGIYSTNNVGTGTPSVIDNDGATVLTANAHFQTTTTYFDRVGTTDQTNVYTDFSQANITATINDLREAFQIQKLLERDSRSGTRYSELVRNHFGVSFYDVSYRPEYLGGGSTPLITHHVPLTGFASGTHTNVGDLGAFGTAGFNDHGFSKSFVEHGIIIGLISARADLTYQQGIPRMFSKQTRYDIYWPSLAHLGEQEVLMSEIEHTGTSADDDVFGYQERYAEYRYKNSQVTGAFRSTHSAPLDAWHLSQELSAVSLGPTFIEEDPPMDRVVQVTTEPHFILDSYIKMICARPMPVFGVPGMIDHF